MDVKSESWRRPPKPRHDSTSYLHRTPEWRRSGDESYWDSLVVQADEPPRRARPQSCIEGRMMDDWFQTLGRLQASPVQQHIPAFTDRTASMPVLPDKIVTGSLHYPSYPYFQKRVGTPSVSTSLGDSSLDSLDSLDTQSGLEIREKAQIKMAPKAQKAKLCRLAPVQIGWLPLQRHVVNTAPHHGKTSQVKLKPPITPVLSSSSLKAYGPEPEDRPAEWSRVRVSSGVQQPWRTPGHSSTQGAGSGNCAPVESDRDTAHDLTSRGQMPRSQSSNLPANGLMWTTPVHRRGSAPFTVPCTDGSPTPKHSSSISSITITSRKVVRSSSLPDTSRLVQAGGRAPSPRTMNTHQADCAKYPNTQITRQGTPCRKVVVVKVTEQRAETRTVLGANDKNSPVNTLSCNQILGETCSSQLSNLTTRKSPSLIPAGFENHFPQAPESVPTRDDPRLGLSGVTSRDNRSPGHSSFATPETPQPVVLRRKATIVKVEHRESYRREAKERLEHRHSYTEGFRDSSSATYTNNPSYANTGPLLTNEPSSAGSESRAFVPAQPSKSNEKARDLHRSTLSFQLSSPSTVGPPFENPHSLQFPWPRRPASCYASMQSLFEPCGSTSKDPGCQKVTSTLSQKTNIDHASPTCSSSNRLWGPDAGAGSRDKIYPGRRSSAGDVEERHGESALHGNQPSFTLIKVPATLRCLLGDSALRKIAGSKISAAKQNRQSSAHATHDTILALNAAAVIANIKRQSKQTKTGQAHSSTKGRIDPSSQGKYAEAITVYNSEEAPLPIKSDTATTVKHWHAEFISLQTTGEPSSSTRTLSEALQQGRPDFIKRSQTRVQAVEQRAQERLQLLNTHTSTHTPVQRQARPTRVQRDNIFKSHYRNVLGKQEQQQFRWNHSNLPEEKRRKEEERRRLASQTNRLKAELFKKKIQEQVLRRGKD